MRNLLILSFVLIFAQAKSQSYFVVSPSEALIFEVDRNTGSTLNSQALSFDGGALNGFTGLAINPIDNEIYVVAKSSGGSRIISILNFSTNQVNQLFTLDNRISSIAFDSDGTCYGITGDGDDDNPSTLYEIDIEAESQTLLIDLSGVGADGEALAFNSNDGLLYRYAGDSVLQSIDLEGFNTTEVDVQAPVPNYGHAMFFEPGNNTFTLGAGDHLYSVGVDGTVTNPLLAEIGDDDGYKGIFLDPEHVSVSEETLNIEIYPNPTADFIQIQGVNVESVKVLSIAGELVLETNESQVDITSLETGIYFLMGTTKEGEVFTERVLKN